MKKQIIFIILVLLCCLISGCATMPGSIQHKPELVQSESTNNKVKDAVIGIDGTFTNQSYIVKKVGPKSPAEIAGIMEGDLLITVDSKKFPSRKGFRDLIRNAISPERDVEISFLRSGNQVVIRLKPIIFDIYPTFKKLKDLAADNKVAIAVVAGDVSNSTYLSPNFDRLDWKQSIKRNMASNVERSLLSTFANNENLKLVDRSLINKIVDEFKFNETGLVSDEMRAKLGKMYGVTHIIQCNMARFPNGNGYEDEINTKLINIQTGTVEAMDYIKNVYR